MPPPPPPSPIAAAPHIHALLTRLHALSAEQEASLRPAPSGPRFVSFDTVDQAGFDAAMRDKFIALDEDKCHFVHQLIRAKGALTVVEAGTSFGVSTIYLALAVSANAAACSCERRRKGRVIATEKEVEKAERARGYWRECGEGVEGVVDLRVGDLLETLRVGVSDVEVLLLDIWSPLALPTLKLVQPKLRPGAVVLTDNSVRSADGYKELLEYLRAPGSGFTNVVLPYDGGLEMSVYYPPL